MDLKRFVLRAPSQPAVTMPAATIDGHGSRRRLGEKYRAGFGYSARPAGMAAVAIGR
jgi:hypothetical protein